MMPLFAIASCAASEPRPEATTLPPSTAEAPFWQTWADGRGEIDGYTLTFPRYGQLRRGEAVEIWVTETFTEASRVKSDGGHDDEFPVLKLNDVRSWQTGIYDYHAMESVFVPLDGREPVGRPTKISLSVTEWCGTMFEEWVAFTGFFHRVRHSYFDGEGDLDDRVATPADGVLAETAPFVARSLPVGLPDRTVDWLPSRLDDRLLHRPPQWTTAVVHTGAPEVRQVPAGAFPAVPVSFTPATGDGITLWVEQAPPHRIVRWERPNGEVAELTGTVREAYWKENGEGNEALRGRLGLGDPSWLRAAPPSPATPPAP